jgi:hypothetical protein
LQFQLSSSFVSNYTVTATGSSGETATAAFTDSQPQSVSIASPTSGTVTPGQTATYGSVTVQVGGNASSCTITLAASAPTGDTGLPSGATASFSPNPNTVAANYTTTSFTVATTAATPSGTYTFHVAAQRATNCQGNGDIQSTQRLTLVVNGKVDQAPLSITAPNSATFGDSDQSITTSGGSGTGAITFDAGTSTACSIVSGKLHVTSGTGSCSITATKAGDASFNPTTSASHAVTINKATPNCSVNGYAVTYDGNAHTATGSCTGVGGAGDVLSGLDLTQTTHTSAGDHPSDPWTFPATTNYNSTSGTVHDSIAKANAVIVVTSYHVMYDGDPHTATGSATGVESPSPADLSALLHLGGTTHTNAGDYPTDGWTFDGNGNYNSASGTVHDIIDRALPTVAITWTGWIVDGTGHAATAVVNGPVTAENPIASPVVTLTYYSGSTASGTPLAGAPSGVGTYTVLAAYAGNANYRPASSTKTVTVTYAPGGACNGEAGHAILQPINPDGSSVSKQGSTVPAKFRVCDASGHSIGTPGVVASFNLIQRISGTVVNAVNETVVSTTPDTAFRWDSTAQQWIFNINTKSLSSNATYVYLITLNDGTTIQFQFGLR